MRFLYKGKDGGPESKVTGFWLFESKKVLSIAFLRFDEGSRESYHTHAFHALSWVIRGKLREVSRSEKTVKDFTASIKPIFTARKNFHRVFGIGERTWAITVRGPWLNEWKEYLPVEDRELILTHGRQEVDARVNP